MPAFEPEQRGRAEPFPDTATLIDIPRAILLRHNLRVLDPTTALVVSTGGQRPRTTVYRADTLLIPRGVLADPRAMAAIDRALADIGLRIEPPGRIRLPDDDNDRQIAVRLVLRPGGRPTAVDAWVALQTLRTGAGGELPAAIRGIGLEHAFLAGAHTFYGVGGPYEGSNPPGNLGSYTRMDGGRPIPVQVPFTRAPERRVVPRPGLPRRPVVAVIDTGLREHPWFQEPPGDRFLSHDPTLQSMIKSVGSANPVDGPLIDGITDLPLDSRPALGNLDSHLGHGTFIAGIIRCAAPDASVLAIRVMHSSGVTLERDLLTALSAVVARVRKAQDGPNPTTTTMVDVVSLSMGCFHENNELDPDSDFVKHIVELVQRGVVVVASAGNHATDRVFFPAALGSPAKSIVAGVGAMNPDNSLALFSNFGPWVRYWRDGVAMVSTFPVDLIGPAQAPVEIPSTGTLPDRRALDPDDFSSGFAVWHGTSFAAPVFAAEVCNALISLGATQSSNSLDKVDKATAVARATAVLSGLQEVNGDVRS